VDITRKSDYAIRMMAALAAVDADCPISVRELADSQSVPYAFARSVQRDLMNAGLVRVTRGASGGMCLARPATEITVLDVVESIQGRLSISVCANDPGWCARSGGCGTHGVWLKADQLVRDLLASRTLAGLHS
jgi:Rrf2 family protein